MNTRQDKVTKRLFLSLLPRGLILNNGILITSLENQFKKPGVLHAQSLASLELQNLMLSFSFCYLILIPDFFIL